MAHINPNTNALKYKDLEVYTIQEFEELIKKQHPQWKVVPCGNPYSPLDAVILDGDGVTVGWLEVKRRNLDISYFVDKASGIFAGIEKVEAARAKLEPVYFLNDLNDGRLLYDLKCPNYSGGLPGYSSHKYDQDEVKKYRPAVDDGVFWDWNSVIWSGHYE